MEDFKNIGLVELSSDELQKIEGGEKEWLLAGWFFGVGVGVLCTGIYLGYNDTATQCR